MNSNDKSSYRNIFKITSILGGTQVINLFIGFLRSKAIAILLGPSGMGISALFISGTNLIQQISKLGLDFSAIRNIIKSYNTKNKEELGKTIIIFKRWLFFSALLGIILTLLFSQPLSIWMFKNKDYTASYCLLSIMVFFNILSSGQLTILQGVRDFKKLAKASVSSAFIGLIIAVPIYFFWGTKGIVPALIMSSFSVLIINALFVKKLNLPSIKMPWKDSIEPGIDMVKLGSVMMISSCIGTIMTLIINSYVSKTGGISDVGLYQAGITITTQYIGLIFSSMSTEFYPRLISVHENIEERNKMINQQSIIVILIITPLLSLLIIFAPYLIRLLYSNEFLSITNLVCWTALGTILKAVSFALGYLSLAKGDKKFFFIFEALLTNLIVLSLNISFYRLWGITGIGISLLVSYFIYLVLLTLFTKKRYNFKYTREFLSIFFILLISISFIFITTLFFTPTFLLWIIRVIILIGITLFSLKELNKRLDIKEFLTKKFRNKEKEEK